MSIKPWDIKKKYFLGDMAIVNGVEAVAARADGVKIICVACPTQLENKVCPGGETCSKSISMDLRWHPLKNYTLMRLRGEV